MQIAKFSMSQRSTNSCTDATHAFPLSPSLIPPPPRTSTPALTPGLCVVGSFRCTCPSALCLSCVCFCAAHYHRTTLSNESVLYSDDDVPSIQFRNVGLFLPHPSNLVIFALQCTSRRADDGFCPLKECLSRGWQDGADSVLHIFDS